MDSNLISRLVKLIGKNNDRIILPDPTTGRTVVIMDLEAYEALLEGTEQGNVAPKKTPEPLSNEVPTHQEKRHSNAPLDSVMGEPVTPPVAPIIEPVDLAPQPLVQEPPATPNIETPKKPVFKAKKQQNNPPKAPEDTERLTDLTQDELLAKINRDIGDWKTAQEIRRTEELQSAARFEPEKVSEETYDEERFYLEPIE
ncbi:hypothetical protein ACFLZO_01055 [Patescibacteria group bacterium]